MGTRKPKGYTIQEGDFYLFTTTQGWEYLQFLGNFDESQYEIVNITAIPEGTYTSSSYMVTYKRRGR
jgi:hypothetical protein